MLPSNSPKLVQVIASGYVSTEQSSHFPFLFNKGKPAMTTYLTDYTISPGMARGHLTHQDLLTQFVSLLVSATYRSMNHTFENLGLNQGDCISHESEPQLRCQNTWHCMIHALILSGQQILAYKLALILQGTSRHRGNTFLRAQYSILLVSVIAPLKYKTPATLNWFSTRAR